MGPQGSVPLNGKSSDVSSVCASGAPAGQMSPSPPSLNTPFRRPLWPSDAARGTTAALSKHRPQEIAFEVPGMEGIFTPFTFSLFFSSVLCIFFSLLFLLDLLLYYSIFKPRHTFPSDSLMQLICKLEMGGPQTVQGLGPEGVDSPQEQMLTEPTPAPVAGGQEQEEKQPPPPPPLTKPGFNSVGSWTRDMWHPCPPQFAFPSV